MENEETHVVPRELRHDLRGRLNGLKLCVAALESQCSRDEAAEFLGDIESLCDKVIVLLDKIDAAIANNAS